MVDINIEEAMNDSKKRISNVQNKDKMIHIALNKLNSIYRAANEQDNNYLAREINIIQKELKHNKTITNTDIKFLEQRLNIINKHIKSGQLEVPKTKNMNVAEVLNNMEESIRNY